MANELNFDISVSLKQAMQLILANPENRYMLRSQPGIGKSSITKMLKAELPKHHVAYMDVPSMDLGDICMPVIDHEHKVTRYYPNARFMFHTGEPVIVNLDEFTKGPDPVKNMLHPLLEAHNPRLGDVPVHKDSIIFMTGNLSTDGVGDSMKGHTLNRIIPLTVRNPTFDEWAEWGMDNGIVPEILAFARQFPQIFASYTDPSQKENPYIYQPHRATMPCVTPRSLERASNVVRMRHEFDQESLIASLTGAIGEAAAKDFSAYLDYSNQLPTWQQTIANPLGALVPTSAGACAIVVFGAIQRVEKDTIDAFMTYLERFEPEWQAAFCINIAKNKTKQVVAFGCKKFSAWVAKNNDLL